MLKLCYPRGWYNCSYSPAGSTYTPGTGVLIASGVYTPAIAIAVGCWSINVGVKIDMFILRQPEHKL